jgi:DNA-binding MarR family transcriptional regulator
MRERVWLTNERLLPLEREFPESYDRETTRIVFAIRSLAQYINDEANVWLAPFGLNAGTYNYLAMLYAAKNRTLTQNDIRKLVHTTHSTVAQVVSALERDGFVKRKPNPGDARSVIVTLTRKGIATVRKALPAHHLAINTRLKELSKPQQRTLLALLESVRSGFDELEGNVPAPKSRKGTSAP